MGGARPGGLAERFKQLDRNGDGKVSREEGGSLSFFDAADKNKDGLLTTEEVQAYFAARRTARPTAEQPVQRRTTPSTPPSTTENELVRKLDIRYAATPGVEAKAQSLDVYAPKDAKKAPVLIFIHGGGWRNGDKAIAYVGSIPAAHFTAHGFVFVSIDYRLVPEGKHPANIQDVAKAVAWVHDHIAEHGGDPTQINIMGHSAGAHLTALIATDETRLKAEGKPLSIIKRAILLDTAAYDIPRYLKDFQEAGAGGPMRQLYTNAFGDTEAQWRDVSPQAHVAPGKNIPPMVSAAAIASAFAALREPVKKSSKPKPFTERMIVACWAYNTSLITFAYRIRPGQTEPSQVALVDTDTGQSRMITGDAGNKIDPWLWQAPEFNGETLLCANVDGRELRLYRDAKRDGSPWQCIATIRLPVDAPHKALKSVEPINGGRAAFGRSYFTVQVGDDKDPENSIWLFGFDPKGDHLIRRLDDGAVTGKVARRLDPESYIGEHELFVHYNLVGEGPSQMHRCRTGVKAVAMSPSVHDQL